MSERTDRHTRRAARRALGPDVVDLIGQHGHVIATQAAQIALLHAQLHAAGFGSNAPQAEQASRVHAADHALLHARAV